MGALVGASMSSCGSSPSMPIGPSTPTSAAINLSGTWSGTGSDSFGPELVTWMLTQSGTSVSGTAELNAVNPADGSCGSCHKVKKGTFSGTLSGASLSVTMTFPAGGDVPTPICVVDLSGSATVLEVRHTVQKQPLRDILGHCVQPSVPSLNKLLAIVIRGPRPVVGKRQRVSEEISPIRTPGTFRAQRT